MWLGDLAQFAGCLVQHFGADYGPGGIGLLVQPLLGEAIQLVLRPHSVLVLRAGDTLNLIAERYGTTLATLRRSNPQLESTQTITAVEGDSLAVLAGLHGTTETKLRSLNPVLQQSEPYVTGAGETLSSVASEQNLCRPAPPCCCLSIAPPRRSRPGCNCWYRVICPPRH
jgi:LysM domain